MGQRSAPARKQQLPVLLLLVVVYGAVAVKDAAVDHAGGRGSARQPSLPARIRHKTSWPFPFLVGNNTVTVCLMPKNGSSRLKLFLAVATGFSIQAFEEWKASSLNVYDAILQHPSQTRTPDEIQRQAMDPAVPRVVVVRNPYVRLLSGYLDKYLTGHVRFDFTPRKDLDFPEFVRRMHERWLRSGTVGTRNIHFLPQSEQCLLRAGYRYDRVLKLEQMACWLRDFARMFGAEHVAASGWEEKSFHNSGGRACFFAPPNVSCADYWGGGAKVVCGCDTAAHRAKDTEHVTNSAALLERYYTPAAALQASEVFGSDLELLQYPAWDGSPGSIRLC